MARYLFFYIILDTQWYMVPVLSSDKQCVDKLPVNISVSGCHSMLSLNVVCLSANILFVCHSVNVVSVCPPIWFVLPVLTVLMTMCLSVTQSMLCLSVHQHGLSIQF